MRLIRDLTAENETVDGEGVARRGGKVVFVRGMLRGETGDVSVTEEGKRFSRGTLASLAAASPDRIAPACPHYAVCGGCSLGHVSRRHELSLKEERVRDALSRIGGFSPESFTVSPIVWGKETGYRNKAELTYDGGFGYVGRDGRPIRIETCPVLPDGMLRVLKNVASLDPAGLSGCVIRENKAGEIMLILTSSREIRFDESFLKENRIASLWRLAPAGRQAHALDGKLTHVSGEKTLDEEICGLRFRLSPLSFFQVNREIAEKLYRRALALASLEKSETAVDAYAGVGAVGMLAARDAGQVVGVEVIPDAVRDAEAAAKENKIENVSFLAGKCEELLPRDPRLKKADAVFLDPPRKGCGRALLDALGEAKPERIVYISCDPATLARDAAILREKGFSLISADPFDMFPGTGHIESVVKLTRDGSRQ